VTPIATLPPPPTRPAALPPGPYALPATALPGRPPDADQRSWVRRKGPTIGVVAAILLAMRLGLESVGALLVGFVLLTPLERAFRRHAQPVRRPGLRTDMVHLLFTGALTSGFAIVAIVVWFILLLPVTRGVPNPLFGLLPPVVQAIAGFVLFEIFGYVAHRALHEVPLFWRFHAVHHSSRNLDWISGARNHPIEGLIVGGLIAPPLLLLGVRAEALGVLTVITGLWGILLHANIRWRLRWMDGWWGTPDYHHWHHSNHPEARNKNYSAFLPVLDRIGGTYWQPADRRPQIYGIDEPMPESWFGQMAHPLRRTRPRKHRLLGSSHPPFSPVVVVPSTPPFPPVFATPLASPFAPLLARSRWDVTMAGRLTPVVPHEPTWLDPTGRPMTPPSVPHRGDDAAHPTTEAGDRELVARIARGDRAALEALYRMHAGWLIARLHGRCQDPELVDTALQDTFLAVWKSASLFRDEGDVGAWLWGIALRRLIDQLRKRRPVPIDPALVVGGATSSAEAELFAAGIGGPLAAALARLEPELQAVMLLTAVDGLSTKEAATVLGIPQGTVKTRLMRARARMQEGLR
jgi:RNA polymerase sigma-70 factor (ECF subfamily)